MPKTWVYGHLWQRSRVNISMKRPVCKACHQRPCAVNYHSDGVIHYRSRCESCARKNRGIRARDPRWKTSGYKKKMLCDRCGFKARFSAQILVFHIDGNLNNVEHKNLRCICKNCEVDVSKNDLVWRPGDLEPDS